GVGPGHTQAGWAAGRRWGLHRGRGRTGILVGPSILLVSAALLLSAARGRAAATGLCAAGASAGAPLGLVLLQKCRRILPTDSKLPGTLDTGPREESVRGRAAIFPIAAGLLMTGCASVPTGLSVLPGTTKSFEQFQVDDAQCRQWALEQTCTTPNQAGAASTATGAAVDTAAGAGPGAAIGAAAGSLATGVAVGAGLLGGTAVGAGNAYGAGASAQNKYDIGYVQCMYAKGN